MKSQILQQFSQSADGLHRAADALAGPLVAAVKLIVDCYRNGGGLLAFGNGGSAADAQHIVAEMVGRFLADRPPLRAQALTTNGSSLTSIANDYDFRDVFARQVRACGRRGDVAIALSTSGNSPNVVAALQAAREIGIGTIVLTGAGGGDCRELADVLLAVPETHTPRVQEAHMVAYHVLCELVEREVFDLE